MDFWDLTKVIVRRWHVALPLLLVSFAATFYVHSSVEPDYKATAYVSLIPPHAPADPKEIVSNPYLDLGLLSLNQSAATVLRERQTLEDLVAMGLSDNIAIDEGYPAPIVTIQVIASNEAQALATADEVVRRYSEAVLSLQADANATANSIIAPKRLDRGANFEVMGGPVKKAMIAVLGAGLMITAAVTIGLDAILRRRAARRAAAAQRVAAGEPPADPEAAVAGTVAMVSASVPVPPARGSLPASDETAASAPVVVRKTEPDETSGASTIVLPLAFRTPSSRGGKRG